MTMRRILAALAVIGACAAQADELKVKMLPGEQWWGLCNFFGTQMPFTEKTKLELDLRKSNYSHQAMSVMVSSSGRAIWCKEPVGVEIDEGEIELESDRGRIVLVEKAGANLREAYRYASRTWFPPTGEEPDLLYFEAPLYNTWIELTYHQNEKDILAYAQSMLDHGLKPGVFMIDDTWQAGYGDWRFEPSRFRDPKGMVDKLHGMGYKVLLWMCPWVSMDSPAFRLLARGLSTETHVRQPTGGFLMDRADEHARPAGVDWWNGVSALLDFSHPQGYRWFDSELKRLADEFGVDGFKFDGGSVSFYTGERATGFRQLFAYDRALSPAAQSALYGDFVLKYKGSEYRNVFGFGGKPVIMRLHDKNHKWSELQKLIPDMLGAGLIGSPFICPDMIGGGNWVAFLPGSAFEPELFIRSAQVHALCPMMQISASPWRVLDKDHQAIFAEIAATRQKFAPRFVELAKMAAKDGEPIMRNLEYAYPGRGYAEIRDEFMMGETLLVAPVVEKGATSRTVVIPPGTWKADDGSTIVGPKTIKVSAPLRRLPYFVREGV